MTHSWLVYQVLHPALAVLCPGAWPSSETFAPVFMAEVKNPLDLKIIEESEPPLAHQKLMHLDSVRIFHRIHGST